MIQFFTAALSPIANLAGSWIDAKTTKQAAEAKLKLTEAEAKAKIMLSEKTSVADWSASWRRARKIQSRMRWSHLPC